MKKIFLLIVLFCSINQVQGQVKDNINRKLIIGTYTSSAASDGIFVYDFDCLTGDFNLKTKIAGVENPTYLALSPDGEHLYSVNEIKEGGISSFSLNSTSGELKFINRVSSGGDGPCYVSVDNSNKYVLAGNYGAGSLSAISLKPDGSLSNDIQTIKHEGGSIDKNRQEGPHVHASVLSPDNKFLFTPNLGTDKLYIYKFDASKPSQPLTPSDPAFVSVKPGSGPRHFTFSTDSKYAYLINELSGIISVFDYNNGKLTEKQTITMLAPDFKGKVGAADIHVSPDGKFLYGSNRGDANELVIYSINNNGTLKYIGRQSTLGKTPRNFVIDPTGNFLLAANQETNDIVIFRRDLKSGLLTPTGKKILVSKPVCLKFVTNVKITRINP